VDNRHQFVIDRLGSVGEVNLVEIALSRNFAQLRSLAGTSFWVQWIKMLLTEVCVAKTDFINKFSNSRRVTCVYPQKLIQIVANEHWETVYIENDRNKTQFDGSIMFPVSYVNAIIGRLSHSCDKEYFRNQVC
jgi:hypothetical protein